MLYVYSICLPGLAIVKRPIYFPQLCGCFNTKLTAFSLLVLTGISVVFPDLVCVCFQALLRTIRCLLILFIFMRVFPCVRASLYIIEDPMAWSVHSQCIQLVSGSQAGLGAKHIYGYERHTALTPDLVLPSQSCQRL